MKKIVTLVLILLVCLYINSNESTVRLTLKPQKDVNHNEDPELKSLTSEDRDLLISDFPEKGKFEKEIFDPPVTISSVTRASVDDPLFNTANSANRWPLVMIQAPQAWDISTGPPI